MIKALDGKSTDLNLNAITQIYSNQAGAMNVGIKRDIRGELNITLGVCEVHIAVSWKKKDRERKGHHSEVTPFTAVLCLVGCAIILHQLGGLCIVIEINIHIHLYLSSISSHSHLYLSISIYIHIYLPVQIHLYSLYLVISICPYSYTSTHSYL